MSRQKPFSCVALAILTLWLFCSPVMAKSDQGQTDAVLDESLPSTKQLGMLVLFNEPDTYSFVTDPFIGLGLIYRFSDFSVSLAGHINYFAFTNPAWAQPAASASTKWLPIGFEFPRIHSTLKFGPGVTIGYLTLPPPGAPVALGGGFSGPNQSLGAFTLDLNLGARWTFLKDLFFEGGPFFQTRFLSPATGSAPVTTSLSVYLNAGAFFF